MMMQLQKSAMGNIKYIGEYELLYENCNLNESCLAKPDMVWLVIYDKSGNVVMKVHQ